MTSSNHLKQMVTTIAIVALALGFGVLLAGKSAQAVDKSETPTIEVIQPAASGVAASNAMCSDSPDSIRGLGGPVIASDSYFQTPGTGCTLYFACWPEGPGLWVCHYYIFCG